MLFLQYAMIPILCTVAFLLLALQEMETKKKWTYKTILLFGGLFALINCVQGLVRLADEQKRKSLEDASAELAHHTNDIAVEISELQKINNELAKNTNTVAQKTHHDVKTLLSLTMDSEWGRVSYTIEFSHTSGAYGFYKSTPPKWDQYAQLLRAQDTKESKTALVFELGGTHSYRFGLVMMYLLSNSTNLDLIAPYMDPSRWETWDKLSVPEFLAPDFVPSPHADYVVFVSSEEEGPRGIGYCSASEMCIQLLKLQKGDEWKEFMDALGEPNVSRAYKEISDILPFMKEIVTGNSLENIAKEMIKGRQSEAMFVRDSEFHVVSIFDIIQVN